MLRNLLSSHHARGVIILTITDLRSNQEHTDEIEAKEVLTKAGLDVLSLSDAGFPQWVIDLTVQGLKLPTFESAYMTKEEIAEKGANDAGKILYHETITLFEFVSFFRVCRVGPEEVGGPGEGGRQSRRAALHPGRPQNARRGHWHFWRGSRRRQELSHNEHS